MTASDYSNSCCVTLHYARQNPGNNYSQSWESGSAGQSHTAQSMNAACAQSKQVWKISLEEKFTHIKFLKSRRIFRSTSMFFDWNVTPYIHWYCTVADSSATMTVIIYQLYSTQKAEVGTWCPTPRPFSPGTSFKLVGCRLGVLLCRLIYCSSTLIYLKIQMPWKKNWCWKIFQLHKARRYTKLAYTDKTQNNSLCRSN